MLTFEYICVIIIDRLDTMKHSKSFVLRFCAHIVGSLLLGVTIYLLFRKDAYLNQWFGIYGPLADLPYPRIINFLRYYFVDALWGYALTFSLALVIPLPIAVIGTIAWGTLWELLQRAGWVNGTFDLVDIFMYLIAAGVAATLIYFFSKEKPHESHYP